MPSPCKAECSARRLRPALGCYVRIAASGLGDDELAAAIDAAYARIEQIEQALSFHRQDSELHALHRAATQRAQQVGTDLWNVVMAAQDFWTRSRGVFDPGIAGALVRDGLLPQPAGLAPPHSDADFGAVELLDDQHLRFKQAVWLDFGGIAKGYAVDQALATLRQAGVRSACVNAGGDLACFGDVQTVALRDPQSPNTHDQTISIRDAACATSGAYFQPGALRERGGGRAPRERGSVTVIAAACMHADALTKVLWVAPQLAAPLLAHYRARFIDLDGAEARSPL